MSLIYDLTMKIGYLSHPGRPAYEDQWLSKLQNCDLTIIMEESGKHPESGNVRYRYSNATNGLRRFLGSTASLAKYRNIEDLLYEQDIIISMEAYSSTTHQALLAGRSANIPVAILVYELLSEHPIYRFPPYRKVLSMSKDQAAHFIAITNSAKEHLVDLGVDAGHVQVIYPGVEQAKQNANREQPLHTLKAIFVGRLAYHKGIDLFVNAHDALSKANIKIEASVAGDGPLLPMVLDYSKSHSNLHYLGGLSQKEVAYQLEHHDVLVAPNRDTYKFGMKIGAEQFGFSIVEGLANGNMVIASDCGAVPEILPPGNLIVSQNDLQAIVDGLKYCSDNKAAIHAQGRLNQTVAKERFDIDKQAASLRHYLETVIGGSRD